jgi:hypothetical protein
LLSRIEITSKAYALVGAGAVDVGAAAELGVVGAPADDGAIAAWPNAVPAQTSPTAKILRIME